MFVPQNMGLDTLFVKISVILAEIWKKIGFSVMAALKGCRQKRTRGKFGDF